GPKTHIQRFRVAPMTGNLREARLRWFGHVIRADNDSFCKIGFNQRASDRKDCPSNDGWTLCTPI
ncbi:hypothetical protein ANCDUO_10549, partial [Ancylostoma duodenale]